MPLKVVSPALPVVVKVKTTEPKTGVCVSIRMPTSVSSKQDSNTFWVAATRNMGVPKCGLTAHGSAPAAYLDTFHDEKDHSQLYWYFGDKNTGKPKSKQIVNVELMS